MEADIPRPAARPRKGVGEAADFEVTFQNEHPPLAQLRHDGGEGESAHTGADDNGVVIG